MSQNIILNKTHIQNIGRGNNILRYNFPKSIEFKEKDTVSLSNLNIYFSWFNITSRNNNNFFQYKWFNNIDGDVDELFDIVIEDGYYSTATLNEYILQVMVNRGHYLETLDGKQFIFFFDLRVNSTYYSTSLTISSLSDLYDFSDGNGLKAVTSVCKNPTNWKIPSTFKSPEIIIPSTNKFGQLIGFTPNSYTLDTTSDVVNRSEKFFSQITPNMLPSSSYIITCNLIKNNLSIPDDIFYSFTIPNNVGIGDIISPIIDNVHSKVKPGIYNHIELRIYDQNFEPLQIKDNELLITLGIYQED